MNHLGNVLGSLNQRCSGNRRTLWLRDILQWPFGNQTLWCAASPHWIRSWPWTFSCWSHMVTITDCRYFRATDHREWRRSSTRWCRKIANWAENSWETRTESIAIARPPAWWIGPASIAAEVSTRLPGRCYTHHFCTVLFFLPFGRSTVTSNVTFLY